MGREVERTEFTREDRTRFRRKVYRCLEVFSQLLDDSRFAAGRPLTGLEVELNLIDAATDPALRSAEVLAAIADPAFQTELAKFNIEVNLVPRQLDEGGLAEFERELSTTLRVAEEKAAPTGAGLVMVGILPTLADAHMSTDSLAPDPRYALLNEQILFARGEDVSLSIDGVEALSITTDSIIPEAACTSAQLHIQVRPESFPAYWNAAQAVAGVQAAVCANAPYLLGRRLWAETRIPLFQQAIDTRTEELKEQGVRPRVWFGERWIASIFDLFEENARYYPALLPVCSDEDPVETYAAGGVPGLDELSLHNGTIYRWNRPVYDAKGGEPHLRVENRVLSAGPSAVDTIANAAFYFGLVRRLAEADRPVWSRMSFSAAEENFESGARHGIDASIFWPGVGMVPVTELVLRRLLPLAHEGLREWGVDDADRERFLGVIEQRCLTGRNGAAWQIATVERLESQGTSRTEALRHMVAAYAAAARTNQPVHTWPLGN